MRKRLAITISLLTMIVVGAFLFGTYVTNPKVMNELRSNPTGDKANKVMILSLASNQSLPVNYIREANTVFVGADGRWWRIIEDNPRVELLIKGEHRFGIAKIVRNAPEYRRQVFSRLRPNALPAWVPEWIGGVLIEIKVSSGGE